MEKIYLVTGAAGHLGGTLCALLRERGERVRALAMAGENVTMLRASGAQVFFGDVTKPETLEAFFSLPEGTQAALLHCAGVVDIAGGTNPAVDAVNVEGTKNVMRLCLAHAVEKVVYVCSVHALPALPEGVVRRETEHYDPAPLDGAYARSKARAAQLVADMVRTQGLPAVTVLPSGILGPGCSRGNHLVQLVKDHCCGRLPAVVKGGYDFVDVRDVAFGVLAACERGTVGESYLLTGSYHTLQEMTALLHALTGRARARALPMWLARLAAPFFERRAARRQCKPLFTAYSLRVVRENALFSHEKAERELGYAPRGLDETLADTVAWLEQTGEVPKPKAPMKKRCTRRIRSGAV